MKILVTGNMGYVGPVVVEHLRAAFPDAILEGFDAGFFAPCLTGSHLLPEVALDRQHFGDVRSFDADLLRGVDAVVHLAAISNDPISNQLEEVTYAINHVATVELAKAARAAGVSSFVFASSCSMYGFAAEGDRTESSELNPLTPYAKSKVLAERDLGELGTDDFQISCLRFSTACGMSPRLRLDLVLNDFAACAHVGKPVTVLSDGTPWRPLINVKDMARAIEWAIRRDRDRAFLAVNVGTAGWNYQVKELAEAAARHAENGSVSINTDAPPDKRSYRVDFALYKSLAPEHQPTMDLDSSIVELMEGLGRMGFKDAEFHNSGLMRINHLNMLRDRGLLDEQLHWTRGMVSA